MTAPPPHNTNTHSAQFMGAHPMATAVLPLDAFERFTVDQMFTSSDTESADLDRFGGRSGNGEGNLKLRVE
ncbi:hypothetical protein FS837_012358, partial [Tulasnella sp. UAMH 9824]